MLSIGDKNEKLLARLKLKFDRNIHGPQRMMVLNLNSIVWSTFQNNVDRLTFCLTPLSLNVSTFTQERNQMDTFSKLTELPKMMTFYIWDIIAKNSTFFSTAFKAVTCVSI